VTSFVEKEVTRIRGLMEAREFTAALAASNVLVQRVPENRDVLYMIAVCLRYLGRVDEALTALDALQVLYPRFSRLFQERGNCYVAMRDAPRAIDAFLRAVNLNPALPTSWRALQSLYRMTGNAQDLQLAAAHIATLDRLAPEIVTATAMFSDGDFALAEQVIRPYLLQHGDDVEAMRLLARIGMELDVLDDAEVLLAAVLQKAPDYDAARHDYAATLVKRHKPAQALGELDKLLAKQPGNQLFRTTYANAVVGVGDHERALALYRELLPTAANASEVHLSIAHSLKTLGRTDEAIDAYHASCSARPNYGDAYWSLANLKTYRFSDDELARMREEERNPRTGPVDRYHLCFALGKALEDRGDYAASFGFYARGNVLKKASTHYQPKSTELNTRLQKEVCTRDFLAARAGSGCPAPDPIFIVGLPRSGSTLIEQILASHSQVEGTMELAEIPRLVHQLNGRALGVAAGEPAYPRALTSLTPRDFAAFGADYLARTRIYRIGGRSFFIDKMPNNFRHIGLIHLILPRARIIDARREPMACCFSNFKQLFASGQEFTYSLEDIARYYRTYVDLMQHWDEVLPGKILRVQHEAVVDDLETNVRRLLDFCGLDFEPQCLEFWKTQRSVRTASSEQVRRPIFKEGLDQWRHFEPWLAPLKAALGGQPTDSH
jgi:tetratricopeptide (TPR) repeat protein